MGHSKVSAFEMALESCRKAGYLKEILERDDFVMNYKDWLDYGRDDELAPVIFIAGRHRIFANLHCKARFILTGLRF